MSFLFDFLDNQSVAFLFFSLCVLKIDIQALTLDIDFFHDVKKHS